MDRETTFYEALKARDTRFDGKFFVGVKTTGIYCRPICPARPKRENVEFFDNHLAAETAGYRPCLRCRPESAPQSPAWIGKSAIVRRAAKMIGHQETIQFNEDRFASLFGVSARHLRRVFVEEIGKTPKQLSFENRLNLARKLIVETALPLTEVAFASGFRSVRRFNDAFKARFKRSPVQIRRSPISKQSLKLTLPYRPPYDFAGLMHFYRAHQMGRLEWFEDEKMHRIVEQGGKVGQITISNLPEQSKILLEIDVPDTSMIYSIITRVRNLFDLDSDPVIIANHLERDPKIKSILKKHSGIRLPSGWDPFEVAVATILGQLVSVTMGRMLIGDLVEMLGRETDFIVDGRPIKLFPTPEQIASATLDGLRTTNARKNALKAFAQAVAEKKISLEATQDIDDFLRAMLDLPGIGPWTANYIAMKSLRHTDSFPHTDLILARALEIHSKDIVDQMSPWRGYAAALFWREYSSLLTKVRRSKK